MGASADTSRELKEHLKESVALLRRLRDEIRVEVHLAGMEAKDRWKNLEPQLEQAERVARDISEASKQALQDTVEAFRAFKTFLGAGHDSKPPTKPD
ncbi:MAG: hypothetical protein ACKVPX_14180 [Myxococcaceae bacterium]